jgi:hypothetical protein
MGNYQSFLKIIHFEDFRQFCTYRRGIVCDNDENAYKSCPRANKRTMSNCPVWRCFKDFNIRRKYERNGKPRRKKFKDEED